MKKKGFIPIIASIAILIIALIVLVISVRGILVVNPNGDAEPGCQPKIIPVELSGTVTLAHEGFIFPKYSLGKINGVSILPLSIGDILSTDLGTLTVAFITSDGKKAAETKITPKDFFWVSDQVVPFSLKFNTKDYDCNGIIDDFSGSLKFIFVNDRGETTSDIFKVNVIGGKVQ